MSAPFIPPRRATSSIFARLAGGMQGAAGGAQATRMAPVFTMANSQAPGGYNPGAVNRNIDNRDRHDANQYGHAGFTASAGDKRYKTDRAMRHQFDSLLGQENYRAGREVFSNNAYDAALADPRAQARMFQDFYAQQTNAIAAPIMRQFQQTLASGMGANASRFGGQVGTTEGARSEFGTADVFSRNLGEIIQSNAAQGVNAGMDFTQMLGQRAQAATGNVDTSVANVGAAAQGMQKKGGGIGGFIGGVVGAGVGALAGNPGFGAAAGKKIFGG